MDDFRSDPLDDPIDLRSPEQRAADDLSQRPFAADPAPAALPIQWHGDGPVIARRRELVKGLLPAGEVALLAGQTNSGKTFIGISLAAALATGRAFFGHRIPERGGTLVIAAEGAGTLAERLEAARLDHGLPDRAPIAWVEPSGPLNADAHFDGVVRAATAAGQHMQSRHGVPLRLVIVDTVAAAFSISDENAAGEATAIMRRLQRLHRETGALILAIAHRGKVAENGVRGSSAFAASGDAVLAAHAETDPMSGRVASRSLSLIKHRQRETGWQSGFTLKPVRVGRDDDGEEVFSATIQPIEGIAARAAKVARVPKAAAALMQAYEAAIGEHGRKRRLHGLDGPELLSIERAHLRAEFDRRYAGDGSGEAMRKAFARGLEAAQAARLIGHVNTTEGSFTWKL